MQAASVRAKQILALLVDDDVAYLEVLKFFLERDGSVECEIASSARHALELMSQKAFDAVVSDYLMPDMDGLELLKIVRLQGNEVPFIMLTGRGREDVAIQALNSGADYYIQKGGDPKAQYADLLNMVKRSSMQRRAEKDVVEGEKFLVRLFESIQDGVCILNKDFVIDKVNPTMERWYAESMPLVGKKCYEAFRGRSEPCEVCPTADTIRSGRADTDRIIRSGPGGEGVGWLQAFTFPVFSDTTGEVDRVIEYLRDVTEEENAKLALQGSERRYRAVVDLATEGVLAIETGGRIAFANPSMAKMLGYKVEELAGMQISALVDRGWLESIGPGQLHKVLESGKRVGITLVRKDGSTVDVIMAASPLSSDRDLFDGAVAVVTDASELKSLMEGMISSEEKFAKVFQTSPQMIMIARASDSAILEANDSFLGATGYKLDAILGKSYIELGIVSDELASKMEELLAERGMVFDLEATLGTASGLDRVVRLSSYRLTLQGQMCTVLISCDLTSEGVGTKELRRERDVLKAILDSTPDGAVITDLAGKVLECNAALCSLLGGVPKEHLIGRSVFALLGEDEAAKARRISEKVVSEGAVRDVLFSLTREDGISIRLNASTARVSDSLGKPLYFVSMVRDVTDEDRYRLALEKALEERRQTESIIDNGPAVAVRWLEEPGWPVDYVSGNVRTFGYDAGALTSRSLDFISIIHPDDRTRVAEEAERHLAAGKREFEQEYRIVSPEGTVFWVYDKTTVLRREDGSVIACEGVVVDVTEMKDALEKLSRTEKQLRLFMDMSPLIKFMKDRGGRYVYVNQKHQELFGSASRNWIGKTDLELFPPGVARQLRESDRKVFETGEFHSFIETVPLADGLHEYLTYKFLVPNISGDEDLLAGVAVDMTEQRRSERALKSANEKLGLLGSITRHDIMNQLSVLVGWMEVLREGEKDPARLKRLASMKTASDTIQELLVFATEYQDIGAQKPVWISAKQAFEDGIFGTSLEGVRRNVEVGGLEVYADPMLERVFRNLVDNSIRHGGKVSRISLSGRAEGESLILTYEDDGVGIADDIRERIFERGFGKNTGLGLFMVRQILGLTGITIREAGREGSGAKFEIVVPGGGHRGFADKD